MSLIVHQSASGRAQQLFLLFHGVGAAADDLVPLGRLLAERFPMSAIVSVQAPHDCPYSSGFQWFSLDGITEDSRRQRVAEQMASFRETVALWQGRFGVGAEGTALIGFSQGAIMALESTQADAGLAARVVGLSGRFAALPRHAPENCTVHLIHGKHDGVIPYVHTVTAAERLVELGADVTADVLPFVQHEINQEVADLVIERLTTHVPKRYWDAAQASDPVPRA